MTTRESRAVLDDPRGSVGYRIVQTVADLEGVDPLDLERPLFEVINVEALESLFRTEDTAGRVTFAYLGHRIAVEADGTVDVVE